MGDHAFRGPDLRFGGFEVVRLFAFGHVQLRQFEGVLQIIRLVESLCEKGITEVGEVCFFRAAE